MHLAPGAFDVNTVAGLNPCYNAQPVFPDLDPRTANSAEGKKTALQLSRLTVALDEGSVGGGKGNGSMFVSGATLFIGP